MRVALLEKHSANRGDHTDDERHDRRFKAVALPAGQSEDFDEGDGAARKWLWPHLGRDHHLVAFIDVEIQG
jgi:hypothetical protein